MTVMCCTINEISEVRRETIKFIVLQTPRLSRRGLGWAGRGPPSYKGERGPGPVSELRNTGAGHGQSQHPHHRPHPPLDSPHTGQWSDKLSLVLLDHLKLYL